MAISAVLGVGALVTGKLGGTQGKLLLTMLCVMSACVLAMASTEARGRPGGRVYAGAGVAGSILGYLLLAIGVWAETSRVFEKIAESLALLGMWGAHGALVLCARLDAGRHGWVRPFTLGCAGLFTGLLIYTLWGPVRGEGLGRTIGVLAILTAAGSILVEAFGRLDGPRKTTEGR